MKETGRFPEAVKNPVAIIWPLAFATPIAAVYVPLFLAVILPMMLAVAALANARAGRRLVQIHRNAWLVVGGLILTAAVSSLWSYSLPVTLDKLPKTAATLVAGLLFLGAVSLLGSGERRRILKWLAAGTAAAFALIVVEYALGGLLMPFRDFAADPNRFLNQFNRGLSVLAIFVWPVALCVAQRKLAWGIASIVAVFGILIMFQTSAASAAVLLGAVSFGLVYALPRAGTVLIVAVLAGSIVLAPTIDRELPPPKELFETLSLPRSSYHRLIIWNFATERILDRPWLGWGFNLSRGMPGGKRMIDKMEDALPLHPHNASLQWRLELGLLGALLGAGLFIAATEAAWRHARGRLERAGAMATVTAAFSVAMLSFGIWQTWWVSALYLSAGFCILACGRATESQAP